MVRAEAARHRPLTPSPPVACLVLAAGRASLEGVPVVIARQFRPPPPVWLPPSAGSLASTLTRVRRPQTALPAGFVLPCMAALDELAYDFSLERRVLVELEASRVEAERGLLGASSSSWSFFF